MLGAGIFVAEKNKVIKAFAMFTFILNVGVLSFNNTFGAWLACLVALIFQIVVYVILTKKINKAAVITMLVFIGVTAIAGIWTDNIFSSLWQFFVDIKHVAVDPENADEAGTTRWMLWKFTVERIKERPWFGWGIEGIDEALYKATGSTRPHNEYLQYTVFYGIPAGILYFAGCLSVFIHDLRLKEHLTPMTITCLIAAFGYLVSAFFGNTMFYTAPYLFIFLGLGYASVRERN